MHAEPAAALQPLHLMTALYAPARPSAGSALTTRGREGAPAAWALRSSRDRANFGRSGYRPRFSNTSFATGIAEKTFGQPT